MINHGKFALAGAGKTIGKTIYNHLLKHESSYDYIVLSRNARDDGRTVAVDYTDVDAMARVLDEHKIDTVISTLAVTSDESGQAQINLIDAAVKSSSVRRFMPSEFGARYTEDFVKTMPWCAWKFKAVDRLAASRLEYTLFSVGMFMDYAFTPRIPSAFPEVEFSFVDLDNNVSSIPGDGSAHLVTTHSEDIPKFLLKTLDLPKWDTRYFLRGDRLTFDEYTTLAEEAKGVKFERVYNPVEQLRQGRIELVKSLRKQLPDGVATDGLERMMSGLALIVANSDLDLPRFPGEGTVLNDVFPELETLKIKDAVKIYFSQEK